MRKLSSCLKKASSISPLYLTGVKRSISHLIPKKINNKIQTSSELSLLYPRYGVYVDHILKRSLHSSFSEEDDFSELDMPPEGQGTRLNLMTEKRREFQNSGHLRKAASGMHLRKDNPKIKSLHSQKGNHSPVLCSVVENHTGISRTTKDTEDSPVHVSSNSVSIEKVPTTISLNQLRKAVSEFGEILNASIRSESDGYNRCDVEFKTMESKERAVASGGIIVKSCHLPIRSLYVPENITIRISNISCDTAEPAIHSTCMLCGPVEGLSRTNDSSVDVVFGVKDFSAGEDIVEKLNAMCVDNRWSAEILTEHADVTVKNITTYPSQVQQEAGSELSNLLAEFQRHYLLQKVFLEDLVKLHQTVVHLRSRPTC